MTGCRLLFDSPRPAPDDFMSREPHCCKMPAPAPTPQTMSKGKKQEEVQGGHSSSHTFSYQGGQNFSQRLPVNVPLHLAGQTWLLGVAAPAAREPGRAVSYHHQAPRHRAEIRTPLSATPASRSPAPHLSALLPPIPPCSALGSLFSPVLDPLNKQSDSLKSKPFHDS